MRIVLLALLLAGCASQGVYMETYYDDYRASLVDTVLKAAAAGPHHDAPPAVLNDYAECSADFAVSRMNQADRARMDAWARQEAPLTMDEGHAIEARMTADLGGPLTGGNLDRLSGTCPDKIAAIKQYLG